MTVQSRPAFVWLRPVVQPWLLLGLGLAIMYGPTIFDLTRNLWATDQQGQGPIVLALALWLMWRNWPAVLSADGRLARPWLGWPLIVLSGLAYAVGRSQGIYLFEVGSLVVMICGCILLLRGPAQLRTVGFALFFMLFMVPLPGAVVDALTQPMKLAVSAVAEAVLHAFSYPISRTGVVIQIGPYQLLVADACAGLHTLFTLEALGLLYLHVVRHASILRNVMLAILIVPISFSANVIRVCVLVLITFYFGDEAGQGFVHWFAGMVLFLSALTLTLAVDTLLRRVVAR